MNWLLISVIAQIILGTSAVFDKLLLRKRFPDPWAYTFWASLLALSVVILVPIFGFYSLPAATIFIGILGGAAFSLALFLFFLALREGEASVALPIIGGLAPVFTLLISIPILRAPLTPLELIGFLVLVTGSILLLGAEQKGFRFYIFFIALLSAFLFGVANVLAKLVFNAGPFVTGMVWQRAGGALLVLGLLIHPRLRKRITQSLRETKISGRALYLGNRVYAALGTVLISGAIFLAHPALVDALSGLKYAVIFLGAWLILRETFRGRVLALKIAATFFIILGTLWLSLANYMENYPPPRERKISWGVTFSQKASSELDLDWKENYRAILEELRPQGLRLIAYWNRIEPEDDRWNFEDLDWQMDKAKDAGIPVILAIGQKTPRWPECHIPRWLEGSKEETRKRELFEYLQTIVKRYQDRPHLLYWQVENEPFLLFGECPHSFVAQNLDEEIALVKKLDPNHPILTTDGGEFGDWYRAAKRGDVFGTTLYRKVHSPLFGSFTYPLPPGFYPLKEKITRRLTGKPEQKFIVIELGLEPWGRKAIYQMTPKEQLQLFSIADFENNIAYAQAAGFDTYYLWGGEWWYWLKTKHNDPRFWEAAKNLLSANYKTLKLQAPETQKTKDHQEN
jgi:drug/metabolite transporter (DMT)-like permease